ncbi:hypothetical protein COOONC_08045 [Cooperia oncophora]
MTISIALYRTAGRFPRAVNNLVIPPPVPEKVLVIPPPLPKLAERQQLEILKSDKKRKTWQRVKRGSVIRRVHHTKQSISVLGLWEANPDNPHNRDHANKWWYKPYSVTVDWMGGEVASGGHWAVPAAGVGGTDLYEGVFFPSVGTFLGIPDDYDYD